MRPSLRLLSISRGFTLIEVLTIVVALTVLTAVAITMWRSHTLRERRGDAIQTLLALQSAQDQYFGQHARYASESQISAEPPSGLGISAKSGLGFYEITVRNSKDDLGYWATARAVASDVEPDKRCVEMRIDQNGRRFALDSEGKDRSADCWR